MKLANDSIVFRPQTGLLSIDSGSFPGIADISTWEPTADKIGNSAFVRELIGSDTVTLSKLNIASGAYNFFIFILR